MAFGLEDNYVVLDGNDFDAVKETTTGRNYFADRVAIDGILNYGLVPRNEEVVINLADNGINTPLLIDRVVALAGNSLADELIFTLYRAEAGRLTPIGKQRFSRGQMPVDYPDGIITPDMALGVKPTGADATIAVYVKPVKILFTAVPNPEPTP